MRNLTVLSLAALLLIAAAPAPPFHAWSKPAFTAAQDAGQPVVVFVHASWCITCRKQEPILRQLISDPALKAVTVFVVDYSDKATLKELNVVDRSTLVAFHGKTERGRSSFVTDPAEIRALVSSAL
jgi:thiol-disulfide isomerase/thioredoxin